MAAATYNFAIEQGSDFDITFKYNDENGIGKDLSGSCVVLRLIEGTPPIEFSTATGASLEGIGYLFTANNLGVIRLQISSTSTQLYTFNSSIYDLDIFEIVAGTALKKNIRLSTGTIAITKRNFPQLTACPTAPPSGPNNNDTTTPSTTPTIPDSNDLCLPDCLDIDDVYSVVYSGSGIVINDNQNNSGIISTNDSRSIENIELAINGLRHSSPQDITFLLAAPSGNKILLSSNDKISNYVNGFSFMFSNKAPDTSFLNNISNGGLCRIKDKTAITTFNSGSLNPGFSHLFNHAVTGNWSLLVNDNDIGASGSIDSWKLVVTYTPE
jgi:subtilisin-like proprotein convertase family protein